jgi:hypothetical protein|nr:MAG TPA: distal tail protein [Bacteriophage sp.]
MFTDFEYDGESLSDYKLMVGVINGSSGVQTVSSGAELTFNQVRPVGSSRFNITSAVYESAYSTSFEVFRNPCLASSQDEMSLSIEEISAIQRWLCRKDGYKRFKINQDGFEHVYWNGTFSSKQIELNGQIIGLELTLYTDSSFAFMNEVSVEYNCSAGTSFHFWDNSDEITDFNNQLLPNLEITILSKGNFKLENSRDNKVMKIDNCVSNEIISINGKNQLISSSESSHDLANDFNYFFPRIINSYNDRCNIFTPNLDCKIKITYSPIRKVGI